MLILFQFRELDDEKTTKTGLSYFLSRFWNLWGDFRKKDDFWFTTKGAKIIVRLPIVPDRAISIISVDSKKVTAENISKKFHFFVD